MPLIRVLARKFSLKADHRFDMGSSQNGFMNVPSADWYFYAYPSGLHNSRYVYSGRSVSL